MKTEKTILVKFCGSAAIKNPYRFRPSAGDGICRRGLLIGIFTAAYVAAFWGQAWLNARLAGAEERRSYQRLALFLWLYLALCGTGLAVKILV